MNRFEATNHSTEVVPADRQDIWAALTDPETLTELTPMLHRIDTHGDQWVWHMLGFSALGVEIAPSFTETMEFTPSERIDFAHTPPPDQYERAGADGRYVLEDVDGGTRLDIRLTIHVDLPLPSLSKRAVRRVMEQSMRTTGERFGRNLLAHLGVPAA